MCSKALTRKCFPALLFVVVLVTWDVSCASPATTTQEETTSQETTSQVTQMQKTQPGTTTARSSDLAERLIGTWEATSIEGNPASPGAVVLTFSRDGTLQQYGSQTPTITAQYSVLDESRIQLSYQDGTTGILNYSLNDDTLTTTVGRVNVTFQRRS